MEQRIDPRISVNPLCRARFRTRTRICRNIRVTDLGASGCRILAPAGLVGELGRAPLLEDWRLTGPDLPQGRIQAQVVWVRGAADGTALAGIRFLDLPAGYHDELDGYITYVRKTGIPPVDYTGMPA